MERDVMGVRDMDISNFARSRGMCYLEEKKLKKEKSMLLLRCMPELRWIVLYGVYSARRSNERYAVVIPYH